MVDVLKDYGYIGAAAQNSGVMNLSSNMLALPRFPMSNAYASIKQFEEKLRMKGFNNGKSEFKVHGLAAIDQPLLFITLDSNHFTSENIQGFIAGKNPVLEVKKNSNGKLEVLLFTKEALRSRRTLFTITAKDNSGDWHWMSYVFVQPQIVNR